MKKYETLEIEVIKFDAEDVIVTSSPDVTDPNTPGKEGWG